MTAESKKLNPALKNVIDLAPLGAFILGFYLFGLQGATALLMAVTFAGLAVVYAVERRIAVAPLVTGVMVGIFGALTLMLKDEYFIKIKPTVVNLILAAILLVGLKLGKPLLKYVLEVAFRLDDDGWRGLSLRWGIFFIFLALVNEVVWRNFSTEFWVNFKLFGMLTLNIAFWVVHVPFLQRHMVKE